MKRSKFNLSYTRLLSCDLGELIPCGLLEVLPGDSIQMQTRLLVRCAPMLAPPMHPVRVRLHHWFVPHRLSWSSWENFITGGPDGNDTSVFPTGNTTNYVVGGLHDYLGAPTGTPMPVVGALPVRGYQRIWNEWYRDQDLQTAALVSTGSGVDGVTSTSLQNCAWEKDYFTSARPWEQKGPAVSIPLSGTATVTLVPFGTNNNAMQVRRADNDVLASSLNTLQTDSGGNFEQTTGALNSVLDPNGRLQANLVSGGITVNQLRQSLAIQRFEEARAMYGSRYVEYLRAIGVRSSDARLQRPEYLGGGVQTIQFSEVLQTAADGANPVSTMRGHGISAMRSNRFRKFFEEHGYVYTLLSVIPKTIYSDGMPRTFNRRTKFDFWTKELQDIGQQSVLNKEVRGLHAAPDGVFGYQDRYDEYRRMESGVSGEFRTTLNYWHFARQFAADPALNSTFVSAVPPERPFAAPSADVLYVHAHHSVQARRLVSKKATPRTF